VPRCRCGVPAVVFTRCLVCQIPFPANELLAHFSTGNQIAFDPDRGRLWAICRACRRWSLAPIEEAGSPLKLARLMVRDGRRFGEIQRTRAPRLEIAANEHAEQRLLELELAELEATWKHEEELVAIVVGELTSVPLFEQLCRRMAGQR